MLYLSWVEVVPFYIDNLRFHKIFNRTIRVTCDPSSDPTMPRTRKALQKPKKGATTGSVNATPVKFSRDKKVSDYFPPSPTSPPKGDLLVKAEYVNTKEVFIENCAESTCYLGPTQDESLVPREVDSLLNCLPTPEDYPDKHEKKLVIRTDCSRTVSSGKARPGTTTSKRQQDDKPKPNHQITEYFSVRKSHRRTAKQLQRDKAAEMLEKTVNKCTDGLEVKDYGLKGRGVMATKPFQKGDFVVEYEGDLVELKEAYSREQEYKKDTSFGCYMYFFTHKDKRYCIDATSESGRLGRLLNHSRGKPNCVTKSLDIGGDPHLILVAARDIAAGEELVYDYGDRDKEALENNPWLKD